MAAQRFAAGLPAGAARSLARAAAELKRLLEGQPVAVAGLILAGATALALSLAVLQLFAGLDVSDMFEDMHAGKRDTLFFAVLSNAAIVLWGLAAIVPLFVAVHLRERQGPELRLLAAGGLLGALLGADDLFLIHDGMLPRLGVPEEVVYAGYVAFAAGLVLRHRLVIVRGEWLLLALAIACLASSLLLDVLNVRFFGHRFLADIAKLAGIAFWAAFFVRLAGSCLRRERTGPSWSAARK